MNVLAEKLAEFLEVGVEKALELYPILRGQFIAYQITDVVASTLFILAIVSIGFSLWVGVLFGISYLDYGIEDKDTIKHKKMFFLTLKFLIPIMIALTLTSMLQILLSPDLMLFKQLL